MRWLWVGLGAFGVLFAFFWIVPNRSDLGSAGDLRCYEVFRDVPSGEPRDEAALWPPGGKCVLETGSGSVVERSRQTPVFEWILSALLGAGIALTVRLAWPAREPSMPVG